MFDDDAKLMVLIDNELHEARRATLLLCLAADDGLRQRYEELRRTNAPTPSPPSGFRRAERLAQPYP